MPPRINKIETSRHTQSTPAPLLCTKKGQYPNLPEQLSQHCTPSTTTALLHLPITEWHTLNPNNKLMTSTLLPSLSTLPRGEPCIQSYIANTAITILDTRPPSSTSFITDAPGKSLSISTNLHSRSVTVTPDDIAKLHKALKTDFVVTPNDHPPLYTSLPTTRLRRRISRLKTLAQEFHGLCKNGVIVSIGGGDSPTLRKEAARAAIGDFAGYSIDGLYAGESPDVRVSCIKAAIGELPECGIRLLSGGSGAPWEVIAAVREGVDVVACDYPFERAAGGWGVDLEQGDMVNVRDRKWETCKDVLVRSCGCFVCRHGFSRAYLRHLFEVHEICAVSFLAAHNLWNYFCWFERLREAVRGGTFERFVEDFEKCREGVRVAGA